MIEPLTPLEQVAVDSEPGRVRYDIRIVWPNGEASAYVSDGTTFERAADSLEVLVDELRASVKAGKA